MEKRRLSPEQTERIVKVANFLFWAPPQSIFGGISNQEAIEAFCAIVDIPEETLSKAIMDMTSGMRQEH